MQFGIFDHVDDSGLPLSDHFEARLQMVEAYEEAGFSRYHVAEHHGTPLGHAPSPGLWLAAVSQRTSRIRFGPLVYLLPLYHPLRLVEEIGMLDALSGGRLEFGYGRGISPIEMGFYGVDRAEQADRAAEVLEVVRKGLTQDRLSHQGRFFTFDDVPMMQRPVQQPHPPLWYGTNSPGSVERCAQDRLNMVTLLAGEPMRQMVAGYKAAYAASGGAPEDMPLVGVGRHIVVADSDEEALAIARPAFARWRASFVHLWEQRGADNPFVANFPKDWDAVAAAGTACAGSPATVRDFLLKDAEQGGYTYCMAQLAFGDMGVEQVRRSAQIFGSEVMPAFG
ncbi:LLM class flavin-dependent oxidoreductase [Alteraurantiacibacter aquimixticola]|uniref:LLM class flavin-dependent oxidoreductase n=1 Tax=Alteraurantiacibacter aquimixticola TaxID=2489173 RepID=A0A4V4U927_9SPHN|nr:LLM class flavin-dependent oxidoreductase [Alteraurantiacibacter aquimixticola]TIX48937.1 LLM class flavin-dependent oxidoreductase [Alteraurantiacibacter aquimixticola]